MSITTADGIVAGFVPPYNFYKISAPAGFANEAIGVRHSLFYLPGYPGAAVAPSPGLAGAALTSYSGQIPFANPASGNSYFARLLGTFVGGTFGQFLVADRLWHNSGISSTTTTGQTINSVAFPARDADGATAGRGVLVGLEVSAATTNGAAVTGATITYTNSAGTGSRTGFTVAPHIPATAVAGSFIPFQLQAGDLGVRSIQTLTLGTSLASGTVHLVAYRLIAQAPAAVLRGSTVDVVSGGFMRLYDNTVPFVMFLPDGALGTSSSWIGQFVITQG